MRIFAGYDAGESDGFHVFMQSIMDTTSIPVSVTPLHLPMLNFYRDTNNPGTNAFIQSRFLIPFMCEYQGFAVFMDGADMLVRSDLAELKKLIDPMMAVQVVKHDYKTKHERKYIDTALENKNLDYPRKNWSSLMIINCGHYAWRKITPEHIETCEPKSLHRFEFIDDRYIGELPMEWNWLVGEYAYNQKAKLAHYTLGIPSFDHYKNCDYSQEWHKTKGKI